MDTAKQDLQSKTDRVRVLVGEIKTGLSEDFGARINMVSSFLRNVGVASRYRIDVFGEDAKKCAGHITVSMQAATTLSNQIEITLGFFNEYARTAEERQHHTAQTERLREKVNAIQKTMDHVMSIAGADQIPENFGKISEGEDPRKIFSANNQKITESFNSAFTRMKRFEERSTELADIMQKISDQIPGLKDSLGFAHKIKEFAINMRHVDSELHKNMAPYLG